MRGYRYGEIVRQFNQVRRINRIDLLNVKPKVKEKHIYVPIPYHQALRITGKDIRFAYDNMDPILRGNTKRPWIYFTRCQTLSNILVRAELKVENSIRHKRESYWVGQLQTDLDGLNPNKEYRLP
ncbi:hypothetical protein GJ496_000250 [Pomphorhynchus laevis]|nr:hypothetical protein GJ496_000250 [Pomphorhynchus laevis]